MKWNSGIAAAVLAGLLAVPAGAATVTYQSAEANPKVQLVVDDSVGPGVFKFTLTTIAGVADFLGLGFITKGALPVTGKSLVSFTSPDASPNTPVLKLYGNDTGAVTNCGNGCNFNGSSAGPFDYIIRIGENGGGKDFVSSVVFTLNVAGSLADNPFSGFGVRAQNTSGPENSIKYALALVPPPAAVPLPAAGGLMIAGLGALAALRRRRKAA